MKTVVSIQEVSEFDIKPPEAIVRWRQLVAEEIASQWNSRSDWIDARWPGCDPADFTPAFERYGIPYVECTTCGSLFAARRPAEAALSRWYRESKPATVWRDQILPASEAARREKIMRPRADWILDGIAEYHASAKRVVDLAPHGRGLLDMLVADDPTLRIVAAGQTADLEGGSSTGIATVPTPLADLSRQGPADIVIAIDRLNRVADPVAFLRALDDTLAPNGLVFGTASVASGFEIQALWEHSPTIMPPDKLNLPSVQALHTLFASPRWEILELSTPGMFDIQVVREVMAQLKGAAWPRVVRALVERTDHASQLAFVEFLQTRRLTSFARFVIRKRG